jgi:hypothetical protein
MIIESGEYKLISGKVKKKVDITVSPTKLIFEFGYDEYLKDEVKVMDGARWNPEEGHWHAKNNRHNQFQLEYLMGLNPYKKWDQPLKEFEFRVPLFPQQTQMAREGLTYHQMIWAAEMGLGKTLAAFMVIENLEMPNGAEGWWVGPRSALASFEVEIDKWGLLKNFPTEIITYEGLVKLLREWPKGKKIPYYIFLDESSRVKTPGAKRSGAAWMISEAMRDEHEDPVIIEMTGTPAPKSPADWFHQCEIACPGFIREGDIYKFKNRLAYIEREQNAQTGGFYPKLLGWKDGASRCAVCGQESNGHDLTDKGMTHSFQPGPNEVAKLYRRMKGLVSVYYKRDWMKFLPEKNYRILRCKPSRALLNAASIVKESSSSVIQALTRLRELSDGFQYEDVPSGNYTICELCHGSKRVNVPDYVDEDVAEDIFDVKMVEIECTNCNGTGQVESIRRITNAAGSPKDDLLDEIIDDHDEDGRLIVYAGFTGSIDRVQEIFTRKGWEWIRVDGRGWSSSVAKWTKPVQMLKGFQDKSEKTGLPKVAYVAHPMSGGMGVTLTAAFEEVFYSNDFNAESRIQAEDRAHRPGMDLNRGLMITDLVNLPSDELIIENHRQKRRLQDMSMGQFKESLTLDLQR